MIRFMLIANTAFLFAVASMPVMAQSSAGVNIGEVMKQAAREARPPFDDPAESHQDKSPAFAEHSSLVAQLNERLRALVKQNSARPPSTANRLQSLYSLNGRLGVEITGGDFERAEETAQTFNKEAVELLPVLKCEAEQLASLGKITGCGG